MTTNLRFAVYVISGAIATWGLGVFVYDGMTKVPTFAQRLSFLQQLAENESDYLRWQAGHFDRDSPYYFSRIVSDYKPLNGTQSNLVHPVLKVKAGGHLSNEQFKKVDFRRFRNFETAIQSAIFEALFAQSEKSATEQFCEVVKGMSQVQVESWLGAPDWRCDDVGCWVSLKPGQHRVIYSFGHTFVPAKLIFDKGVCSQASVCGSAEFEDYVSWREHKIKQTSIGQPLTTIITINGEPDRATVIGDFERKLASHQSNENIYYKTGNLQTLVLEIRNGFCMQACPIYEFRD